jgi:hypothetical protein
LPRFFVLKLAFPFSAPGTVEITTGGIKANAERKAVVKNIKIAASLNLDCTAVSYLFIITQRNESAESNEGQKGEESRNNREEPIWQRKRKKSG